MVTASTVHTNRQEENENDGGRDVLAAEVEAEKRTGQDRTWFSLLGISELLIQTTFEQ